MSILFRLIAVVTCLLPMAAAADRCGDPSPTLTDGGSLHEASSETALTGAQRAALERLLERFDGDWRGTGEGVMCLGQNDNIRERVTPYTIEAEGQGSRTRGQVNVELKHERGTITDRLRLVLADDRLKLRDNIDGVELISASSNMVEYLHRYRTNEGRTPMEARWRVSISGNGINTRMLAEHWVYAPGGLGSYGHWMLRRR